MKKERKIRGAGFSPAGYLMFFLTMAATVTCAVLIYSATADAYPGDKGVIAGVMFANIVALSLVCTLIDWIRRSVTVEKPVKKILTATERIASGDFGVRLDVARPPDKCTEFDCIMENLNKMAAELSKNELLKTDFIGDVSHELKTPLAIIQNYAAALKNDGLDRDTRAQYADTLVSAAKRLNDLIVNILKLNKLDNQEITPEEGEIELGEMLRECVLQYEELFEKKNLDIECEIDDMRVYSSANYLEIVWNNLLSNAVKFTDPGGKISVALKARNGFAEAKFSDTGCGISPEVGARIFDKFYQGDAARAEEGNGLGLALVKKVIDILGGEISVESVPGKGSTFTVRLHCGAPQGEANGKA